MIKRGDAWITFTASCDKCGNSIGTMRFHPINSSYPNLTCKWKLLFFLSMPNAKLITYNFKWKNWVYYKKKAKKNPKNYFQYWKFNFMYMYSNWCSYFWLSLLSRRLWRKPFLSIPTHYAATREEQIIKYSNFNLYFTTLYILIYFNKNMIFI